MEKELPSWDLSDLFSSIDDPKIADLLQSSLKNAKDFRANYYGKLAAYVEKGGNIARLIEEYEAILNDIVKPQAYAYLVFSTNTLLAANGAFLQKTNANVAEISNELIFFELELTNLDERVFQLLLDDKELGNYRHYLEKLSAWKKHRLSEKEEQLLEIKSLTGAQAWIRLYEQELSQQKFHLTLDGKETVMTQAEILNILYANDQQEVRKQAAEVFTQTLLTKESVLTFAFNMLAEDKKVNDSLLGFEFPEQARHLSNEAEPQAVETLASVVEKNYTLVQDYYRFKKEVLGLEKLYDFDRYAPVQTKDKKYSYSEAQQIVQETFAKFDPQFAKITNDFFANNWIDSAPSQGKRSGAYCEGATPQLHPYVFLNFTGSVNDIMTMAHELGHGLHFELARAQSYLNYHTTLTLAETASTLAETLTFDNLVAQEQDPKILLGLYMQKIESIFASVFRQISMYRFEQDFHNTYRQSGELTLTQINALWMARQKQMFADSVELTSDYENWWLYISHFVHTPFYVYAYAFGELLAFGLLERSKQNSAEFPAQYRQFLQAAGSKTPQELAKIFDIDLEDEAFWASGMNTIREYIVKAKDLYKQIA